MVFGIAQTGAKTILGFYQGVTENQQICDQLLEEVGRVVIDGDRCVRASIKKLCSERSLV
jgi:hypothetical protein